MGLNYFRGLTSDVCLGRTLELTTTVRTWLRRDAANHILTLTMILADAFGAFSSRLCTSVERCFSHTVAVVFSHRALVPELQSSAELTLRPALSMSATRHPVRAILGGLSQSVLIEAHALFRFGLSVSEI